MNTHESMLHEPRAALAPTLRAPLSAAAAAPAGVQPLRPRRLQSEQLLAGQAEIEIAHGPSVYRLRLTSQGKLILTK